MNASRIVSEPAGLLDVSRDEAEALLRDAVGLLKSRGEPMLVRVGGTGTVLFSGDIHGDFTVMKAVVQRFIDEKDCSVVFLGDIIDRAPDDCPFGSVHSYLLALALKLAFPDRVTLLMGNHEGGHVIPCYPYEFYNECRERFGSVDVHPLFEECFSMLPWMAQTSNGVFCAHGGIPELEDWRTRGRNDAELAAYVTWGDPVDFGMDRGFAEKYDFSKEELEGFLGSVGARAFVRGHGYDTIGAVIYGGRCLTLNTSRRFRDHGNGGVLLGRTGPDREVVSAWNIAVEELAEGKWVEYEPAFLEE